MKYEPCELPKVLHVKGVVRLSREEYRQALVEYITKRDPTIKTPFGIDSVDDTRDSGVGRLEPIAVAISHTQKIRPATEAEEANDRS